MNLGKIDDSFFVSPQLTPDAVTALAQKGVKAIINNRPDTEIGFYPKSAEIARLAAENGLEYRHIPINLAGLSLEDVKAFAEALDDLPKPVVGYCASGLRSANMWALSSAKNKSPDDIIATGAASGFNFSAMRPTLMQLATAL